MPSQRARTTCFFGTAARDAAKSVLSVCYEEKKKMSLSFIGLVQGETLPRFHSEEFAQSDEFAQFAFNLLMRPDDHATKSRSSLSASFHTVSGSG